MFAITGSIKRVQEIAEQGTPLLIAIFSVLFAPEKSEYYPSSAVVSLG